MPPADSRPAWPEAITPHIGMAVQGDQRFPRPALEAEFDSALTRGNGGTLFGLRRIGKSSEAVACAQRLGHMGYKVIAEDVQGKTSEAELLCAVLGQMRAYNFGDRVLQWISNDSAIAAGTREAIKLFSTNTGDIQAYFGPIAASIKRAFEGSNEKVVLMIDELPWLCRSILQGDASAGRSRVDVLLAALRGWRGAGMRMLLMGSIGLVGLGREYQLDLSHLNDLTPLAVPPLDLAEAQALVRALAVGGQITGWTAAHTDVLLEESAAFYPAIVQRGFEKVTIGGKAARLDRIPDIFADHVRPDLDAAFFQQFDNRVQRYRTLGTPLADLLPSILDTVLASTAPVAREALKTRAGAEVEDADLGDALHILREDGFLALRIARDGAQHWRVASSLVTLWRQQRRGGTPR